MKNSTFQPELRNDHISTLELLNQVRITSVYLTTNALTVIHGVVGGVWLLPSLLTLTLLISFFEPLFPLALIDQSFLCCMVGIGSYLF
jgi:hypothetical protein